VLVSTTTEPVPIRGSRAPRGELPDTLASDGADAIKVAAEHGRRHPGDRPDDAADDRDELARLCVRNDPGMKVLYPPASAQPVQEKVTLWADEAYLDKPCSVKGLLQAVSLLLFGHFEVPKELTS